MTDNSMVRAFEIFVPIPWVVLIGVVYDRGPKIAVASIAGLTTDSMGVGVISFLTLGRDEHGH